MTLKELSAQYEAAAQPLRERLRELRGQLAQTNDPEEIWHLKRRIAELSPMLTQMNELAWMLEHYYERGGADRDDRYGFNGIRRIRAKKAPKGNSRAYRPGRTDGTPAPDFPSLPLSGPEHNPDISHPRRKQKHRKPHLEACGIENSPHHEIPLGFDDALLDSLFDSSPKT